MIDDSGPEGPYGQWLFDPIRASYDFVVFGFHYAGTGAASTYKAWPREIGRGGLCAIQPPGRETRFGEEACKDHEDFARSLVPELVPFLNQKFAFLGHCGAFPYMLKVVHRLNELGLPLPHRLFASSWGPPHLGPYGRLNLVPLETVNPIQEIQETAFARLGYTLSADLADFAAEILLTDLQIQRTFSYDGIPLVPSPTVVVSWTDDTVVPVDETEDVRWEDVAEAKFHRLPGDHWEFLRAPRSLIELISDEMSR